jgi:hypothetical protein
VVFLPGLASHGTPPGFDAIRQALVRDFGYSPADFRSFGYAAAGSEAYAPCDTWQPIARSEQLLAADMVQWERSRPGGTRFVLVGHSMGGLLAYLAPSGTVDTVVTVDSPLHGISVGWAIAARVLFDVGGANCPYIASGNNGDGALTELNAIWLSTSWSSTLGSTYARLKSTGTRVGVVGNQADCMYWLYLCHQTLGALSVDSRGSQYGPSDWEKVLSVGAESPDVVARHDAALSAAASEIAGFVGRQ